MALSAAQVRSIVVKGFDAAGDLIQSGTLRQRSTASYDPATLSATQSTTDMACRVLFDGMGSDDASGNAGASHVPDELKVLVADLTVEPVKADILIVNGVTYTVREVEDGSAGTGHLFNLKIFRVG